MIVEFDCQVCRTHVRKRRSPSNGAERARFCSRQCYGAAMRGRGKGKTPNHEFTCGICGVPCVVYRSPSATPPRFCSVQCTGIAQRAEHNPAWAGGRRQHAQGYVWIYTPDHPDADVRGCVLEHRLVMEAAVGRRLRSEEVVHHVNGVKDDNRIENLRLLADQAEHMRVHREEEKRCAV